MQISVQNELSSLTTIDKFAIDKLFNKVEYCIVDGIDKAIKNKENIVEFNFSFGDIIVCIQDDSIKYKFMPTKSLENSIVKCIVDGENSLDLLIEASLKQRLTSIYKEML